MTIDKEIKLLEQQYIQLSELYDTLCELSEIYYDTNQYDALLTVVHQTKNSIVNLLNEKRNYELCVAA